MGWMDGLTDGRTNERIFNRSTASQSCSCSMMYAFKYAQVCNLIVIQAARPYMPSYIHSLCKYIYEYNNKPIPFDSFETSWVCEPASYVHKFLFRIGFCWFAGIRYWLNWKRVKECYLQNPIAYDTHTHTHLNSKQIINKRRQLFQI